MPNPTRPSSSSSTTKEPASKLSASQREEIVKLLTEIATIHGDTVSGPRMYGVMMMVDDLPFDALRRVLASWTKHSDWFPKPRQVREAVLGNESRNLDAEAELAWHRVLDCAGRWTPESEYEYPANSGLSARDKFALCSVGGLTRIFNLSREGSDFSFARKDFIHAWRCSLVALDGRKALPEGDRDEKDSTALAPGDVSQGKEV